MKNILVTICFLAVLIGNPAMAVIRNVPDDYATIRDAYLASVDFDTIVIEPGIYTGADNRQIKLNGKSLTIRSADPCDPNTVNNTIIDCEGVARAFACYLGENIDVTISGLTITNGYDVLGGAIYSYYNSSPTISNCVFTNNSAIYGGAIATINSKSCPTVTNCIITANSALSGGGFYCNGGSPTIKNCIIAGNTAVNGTASGGGFYCNGGSPTIKNCIIAGNTANNGAAICSINAGNPIVNNCTITANASTESAGGIHCYNTSNAALKNNILWGNTAPLAPEVNVSSQGTPTSIKISYCDIQNPENSVVCDGNSTIEWGLGNIDSDPCFTEMGSINNQIYVAGNYHLLEESACINAGDPDSNVAPGETDIDGNRRILGGIIDIGADEYVPPITANVKITPQALNLISNGNWINCTIQLPDNYNAANIDTATIVLNEKIKPQWSNIEEYGLKLLVKFNRAEVQNMLQGTDDAALLSIMGLLKDGTVFKGTDTIKIISAGGKK